jgi:hypothetical protein
MSKAVNCQETAVEQVRRVRDELNQAIEETSGEALLAHVHGHQYKTPFLRRLASRVAAKSKVSEASRTNN